MTNINPYITYDDFKTQIVLFIHARELWDELDSLEKKDIWVRTSQIIDSEFNFIGRQVSKSAFPRDFGEIINDMSIPKEKRDYLQTYNLKIPYELADTCIYIGRDLLFRIDLEPLIQAKDKLGAKRLEIANVEVEMDKPSNSLSYESVRFLRNFQNLYFAFQIQ